MLVAISCGLILLIANFTCRSGIFAPQYALYQNYRRTTKRRRAIVPQSGMRNSCSRFLISTKPAPESLRKNRVRNFLRLRSQVFVLFKKTHAGIPAENRVIVACRPQAFRFFEETQRPDDPIVDVAAGANRAGIAAGLGAPLPRDPGIVGAIVRRLQAGHGPYGAGKRARVLRNRVGQGQDQADARLPVGWVNVEDVAADAFGFVRLIQQAVAFGLGQRAADAVTRDGFQCEHGTSLYFRGC